MKAVAFATNDIAVAAWTFGARVRGPCAAGDARLAARPARAGDGARPQARAVRNKTVSHATGHPHPAHR